MNRLVRAELNLGQHLILKASMLGSIVLTALSAPIVGSIDDYPQVAEITASAPVLGPDSSETAVVNSVSFTCEPDGHSCTPEEAITSATTSKDRSEVADYFARHKKDKLEVVADRTYESVTVVPQHQYAAALADNRRPIKTNTDEVELRSDTMSCNIEPKQLTFHVHTSKENSGTIPLSFFPVPFVWIRRRKSTNNAAPSEGSSEPTTTPETIDQHPAFTNSSPMSKTSSRVTREQASKPRRFAHAVLAGALVTAAAFGAKSYHDHSIGHNECGITIGKAIDSWNPHLGFATCDTAGHQVPDQPVVDELAFDLTACQNIQINNPPLEPAAQDFLRNAPALN